MARLHAIALLGLLAAAPAQAADDAALVHARELLDRVILFDGHNDLPIAIREDAVAKGDVSKYDLRVRARGNTDIPRLREGRLGAQFWSVYIPGEMGAGFARMELEQIAIARQVIADYPDAFRLAGTAEEIRAARRAGRIGSMLGIEVSDLGLRWVVVLRGRRLAVCAPATVAEATVRGSATDLLLLASRLEDADTLFFQRRLRLTGDTELGLTARNLLDQLPWESVPAPLRIALEKAAQLARALRDAQSAH